MHSQHISTNDGNKITTNRLVSMGSSPSPSAQAGRWILLPEEKVETSSTEVSSDTSALKRVSPPDSISTLSNSIGSLMNPMRGSPRLGKVGASVPTLPPSLSTSVATDHVFRFASTSATLTTVTSSSLLGAMGAYGTSTTATRSVHSSVRISSVTIWSSSGSTASVSPDVVWAGGTTSQVPDTARVSSIPLGITASRGLIFVPPKMSLASNWLSAQAINMFAISAPLGSIIDVHVSGRLSNVFSGVVLPVTSAVVGTLYYLSLDPSATNKFIPVGLPTTS